MRYTPVSRHSPWLLHEPKHCTTTHIHLTYLLHLIPVAWTAAPASSPPHDLTRSSPQLLSQHSRTHTLLLQTLRHRIHSRFSHSGSPLRPATRSLRHIRRTCHDGQTPRHASASVSHSPPSRFCRFHDSIFAFRSVVRHYAATPTYCTRRRPRATLITVHYIIIRRCPFVHPSIRIPIHTQFKPSSQYVCKYIVCFRRYFMVH